MLNEYSDLRLIMAKSKQKRNFLNVEVKPIIVIEKKVNIHFRASTGKQIFDKTEKFPLRRLTMRRKGNFRGKLAKINILKIFPFHKL